MIALERELVVDAAELAIGRSEYRVEVSLEASNPPRREQLCTTETDGASDSELTDVGQPLFSIEVRAIHAERELSGWKRLGGRYKPQPGVAEVSR
jgi:hypothetical protein